jgi:hypothetical protein
MGRPRRFVGYARALALVVFVFGFAGGASAATIVAGTTFDDDAFADVLISSSGSIVAIPSTSTLEEVLTDSDLTTYSFFLEASAYVQMGFTDNVVVNDAGSDIALYELGTTPDSFQVSLTVGGVTRIVDGNYTGFDVTPSGATSPSPVNVAMVELSDFGLELGAVVDEIVIGAVTDGYPTLAVIGALNSAAPPPTTHTPEPGPVALFFTGSLIVGVALRRKLL